MHCIKNEMLLKNHMLHHKQISHNWVSATQTLHPMHADAAAEQISRVFASSPGALKQSLINY